MTTHSRDKVSPEIQIPSHPTALLEGVRILDLSQYIPGPYATRLMADLGADVIKVEPPWGEPTRRLMVSDPKTISPLYTHLNRGKRIALIDLKQNEGRSRFESLIAGADVLLDGFRPGTLDRLGLDESRLRSINQALVVCRLSGFGLTGPYRLKGGHDIGYLAAAGYFSDGSGRFHVDEADPLPSIPFPPLADHTGSLQAVNAILAALVHRFRTGKGSALDISLYESIVSWQYFSSTTEVVDMLSGGAAYYNIYRTRDGRFVTLGAIELHFWKGFCEAMGETAWLDRYHDPLPQTELKKALAARFEIEPLSHWEQVFANVDCCFEPIPKEGEAGIHSQTRARGILMEPDSGGGSHRTLSYPGKINAQSTPIRSEPVTLVPGEELWLGK